MPSFLESLYYGQLNPAEKAVSTDPQYRQLSRQLSESMEVWMKKLSDDDFHELEELLDLCRQVQGLEMAASFADGFRLGARMIIEVYSEIV
ncbi:hypothetical protein C7121_04680 [Paenibacillus glucanolyticus]|jgi:hypothetical protein|uniref:DUF6809 family protein n=1 Tax=Paenibacillus TaxID=44249 RepID=UPI0003E22100|nr:MULTISPECIES: DUF6809 family protein [Paenibacillus]ANA80438.1 hypothetical protein A3958_10840 [Paenibacillus glucanolyticus]AVV55492.1 hypothetical protein C7121_04680 [Paenibacillus glucanolyticus]ETT30646.1 hypothetical protein C169_28102 [Paenibacillus sp. FSL R5-808]MPY15810.1 hypothetical protein [Paenibacillus glucanolyticus]